MINKNKTAREKCLDFMANLMKQQGLDELHSQILSILFLEPKELSLEEITQISGYSPAAVSTAMKMFQLGNLVKRIKKPGSRKVYYYMGKDIESIWINAIKKKVEVLSKGSEHYPLLIKEFKDSIKDSKDPLDKERIEIMQKHNQQMNKSIIILQKLIGDWNKIGLK